MTYKNTSNQFLKNIKNSGKKWTKDTKRKMAKTQTAYEYMERSQPNNFTMQINMDLFWH